MSFLLDHCVPNKFLNLLKSWGYTATAVNQHIAADSDDSDVIQLAQKLDAVLVTVDMDFSNIFDYPPQNYAGIVVIRYEPIDEAAVISTLQQALQDLDRDKLRGALIIVQPKRYRIRRPQSEE